MIDPKNKEILFENIYNTCFNKLKHFAVQYVINEEDAENIAQDIFLYLWENNSLLETHPKLESFLFLMTKNKCINFLRRKTTNQKITSLIQEEQAITLRLNMHSLINFEDSLFTQEEIESRLNSAIDNLPCRCSEIFKLSKFEGKAQKDIAKELKISINTVESQMAIAYKKLKSQLSDLFPIIVLIL